MIIISLIHKQTPLARPVCTVA